MGRWQQAHYDDVFAARLKNIVCNIIERNKAEKEGVGASLGPPPISYEAFVEDLDEKDPFTNAVIEALVNEYAERRQRINRVNSPLMIAERTANALHAVVENASTYGDARPRRASQARRESTAEFFLASGVPEWDYFDPGATQDDFDTYLPEPEAGSLLYSNLYDAFSNIGPILPDVNARRLPMDDDDDEAPMPAVPSRLRRIESSTSLVRQPSLRRRSRTGDFNDFTTRRRSAYRSGQSSSMDLANLLAEHPDDHDDTTIYSYRPTRSRYSTLLANASTSSLPPALGDLSVANPASSSATPTHARATLPRLRRQARLPAEGLRQASSLASGANAELASGSRSVSGGSLRQLADEARAAAEPEPLLPTEVPPQNYPTPRSVTPEPVASVSPVV